MNSRVLLLSAYTATSHRLWCERLQTLFPELAWTWLQLPPRHFNWTIRGNSLLWAFRETTLLQQPYDLLLATSMVDLSSLRGFVPALARVPSIVYFHENQFAYPGNGQREDNVEPQLVPLYAALCADRVVFNSNYNRRTFLEGASQLFKRLPDSIPPRVLQQLDASCVIPVPVPAPATSPVTRSARSVPALLEVVWNHRWEYDKGIDLLLATCQQLLTECLPVRLHIVGEQFRQRPQEFEQINAVLQEHARRLHCERGEFGYIAARTDYARLLGRCDVVLSTARHDFQGLAVQEACMAGCTPLAPAALVYPEYLEAGFLYPVGGTLTAQATAICTRLKEWQQAIAAGQPLPRPTLAHYRDDEIRPLYAELFAGLLTGDATTG